MSKLKPALFALSLLMVAPTLVHAGEITLIPVVKLQIGDQDRNGHYWDGGRWRDHDWWKSHYEWRDNRWHQHDDRREPHDNRHGDKHDKHGKGPDWKHH